MSRRPGCSQYTQCIESVRCFRNHLHSITAHSPHTCTDLKSGIRVKVACTANILPKPFTIQSFVKVEPEGKHDGGPSMTAIRTQRLDSSLRASAVFLICLYSGPARNRLLSDISSPRRIPLAPRQSYLDIQLQKFIVVPEIGNRPPAVMTIYRRLLPGT
jgi:hypothetical protein